MNMCTIQNITHQDAVNSTYQQLTPTSCIVVYNIRGEKYYLYYNGTSFCFCDGKVVCSSPNITKNHITTILNDSMLIVDQITVDSTLDVFGLCELSKLFSTGIAFENAKSFILGDKQDMWKCETCNNFLSTKEVMYYDKNPFVKEIGGYRCSKCWCVCMNNINSTPWNYLHRCENCSVVVCKTCVAKHICEYKKR